jgi:GTP-binding protein LepA
MKQEPTRELKAGEVGYVIGSVKSLQDAKVGDTITHQKEKRISRYPVTRM